MSSTICCFCGETVLSEAPVEIAATLEDGATQGFWAHGVCLSERLHASIPTLLPSMEEAEASVFLAVTAQGLQHALRISLGRPVWCSADAVTEHQFFKLKGRNVSRFSYAIKPNEPEVLSDALATIHEHHPGARVWVEGCSEL
jgi:hypothetical protein